MSRKIQAAIFLWVILSLVVVLPGCAGKYMVTPSPDDEKQVKSVAKAMQKAILDRNWIDASYLVDPDIRLLLGPCLTSSEAYFPPNRTISSLEDMKMARPVAPGSQFSHATLNGLTAAVFYFNKKPKEEDTEEEKDENPINIYIVSLKKSAEGWKIVGPFWCSP